ncbi:nck-associated protein 5-like isoform X2 [Gadus macrocephalus]|nr:nck-associated protein 5-like isoform X2 [Gadus macrocephalus]
MVTLQRHFSSMEEAVRTLLQNPDSLEGPKVDPLDLMKAYKDKLLEEMWKQQDSLEAPPAPAHRPAPPQPASGVPEEEKEPNDSRPLVERLRALEAENSALSLENDNQRRQYEHCLDEVANQVVQALLTQKDLKEECVKLRTRVFDLEQQNRILSVLFQQRVKMSTNTNPQEVQKNGKSGVASGRWPSLLSLTCPRSSCSGSELSLSSTCSEYSSGSHTWAEGRGSSKQSATSREKRMSAGSVSSHPSAEPEPAELGWKEGHILKGLKRLQTRSPNRLSPPASAPHYKDCMTSNEGIYCLGARSGAQALDPKQADVKPGTPLFKTEAAVATLISDSDEGDEESPKSVKESCGESTEDSHCLEDTSSTVLGDTETDGHLQEDPMKPQGNPGQFLSPVPDEFLLEGPTVKPGVSPTESPNHLDADEEEPSSLKKQNDRNNNQEKTADRKSRLDYVKKQHDRLVSKQHEKGTTNMTSSIHNAAKRALDSADEARQRSSSMDTPHVRDQASQAGGDSHDLAILESLQKKLKPQACDSARKAFILRSKSADGGSDQTKQLHSPLHQKLFQAQKSKPQPNPPGQSAVGPRSSLGKPPGSCKGAFTKVERGDGAAGSSPSGLIESVAPPSPLSPQMNHGKGFKSAVTLDCPKSPNKAPAQISKLISNNDSGPEDTDSSNIPCTSLKHRHQETQAEASHSELRSPSPPPPPGRSTSLLVRSSLEPSSKTPKSGGQSPATTTGKAKVCSAKSPQGSNTPDVTKSPKHSHVNVMTPKSTRTPAAASVPVQESCASECVQPSMTMSSHDENGASSAVLDQGVIPGEPIFSEVMPQTPYNIHGHGSATSAHNLNSRAALITLPGNAKSIEVIPGQGNSTFLVLGRHNKPALSAKRFQSFETFSQEPHTYQIIHGVHEVGAKEKINRKIETRCSSLDSEPAVQPVAADSGVMLDWGFDEEGWLFKRSVSVSTRPPLKPVMGMTGAKARSQSFGARYMDRPNSNRSGKIRTQIKTQSGSSLNSLGDVFSGSLSCSSSYHCPMNRSLLNNFLIEEGLPVPSHLASSSERLQSLKLQREQARRLQIEQQFSSAFGEPVSEEPESQNAITTIEEKVMLGIEENLHKSQEQEKNNDAKQKSGSSLANWFGFRKSKLPAPSGKKMDVSKVKEEKKEQKITSLLGGKQTKSDKKKERRKSDGKDCSVGRRESHDAVRACIPTACPGAALVPDMQGHADPGPADPKTQVMTQRTDRENGLSVTCPAQDAVIGSTSRMRTLDSGIGTIPLPESCSFFSSLLHLLPRSTSSPVSPVSPGAPGSSSSEEVSATSPLPRWKVPSGVLGAGGGGGGLPGSLSDSSVALVRSVPFPSVACPPPRPPQPPPSVYESHSRLPRPSPGGVEPKKKFIKSKTRPTSGQQKEQTRLQLAN